MKNIKKAAALVLAASVTAAAAGCSNTNISFSGAYWYADPMATAVSEIYEKSVYKVSSPKEAEFAISESSVERLKFETGVGSEYITELEAVGGEYVYKTTLKLSGRYVFGDFSYEVEDDETYTETRFKGLKDKFEPVYSKITVFNTVPFSSEPTDESSFAKVTYEREIFYGDKAEVKTTAVKDADDQSKIYAEAKTSDFDYKGGTYIDDNSLIFVFRAMNFDANSNFTVNTLNNSGDGTTSVSVTPVSVPVQQGDTEQKVIPITLPSYSENGNSSNDKKVEAFGVAFKTTGTYGQTFRIVYYGVNPKDENGADKDNSSRHRPIKIYQPTIYNGGYICYTLSSVTNNKI